MINQRCQGRRFAVVAMRAIEAHPKLSKHLHQLVLCSLLGNYPISRASSRPSPKIRSLLFDLLSVANPSQPSDWLLLVLHKARVIIMYALREQVVFALLDQPGVLQQVSALMNFDAFREIVVEAMSTIRDYLSRMLNSPESSLYQATFHNSECARWVEEINFLVQPFNAALLKISYRRPKHSFRQFVMSISKLSHSPTDVEIPRLLSDDEIASLRVLAERLSDWRSGQLTEMVRWFDLLGISKEVVSFLLLLMQHHATGATSLGRLKQLLMQLQKHQPKACHALLIAAIVQQDVQRVRFAGKLPYAYVHNQIEACQARFGMKSSDLNQAGAVLSHLFHFVYCSVCFSVYSLLADFDSVYKQDYSHGYRDAVVEYQSMQLYCHRNRHNYRGSCHAQPLRRVFLLGNALNVGGRMVMLCPQEKCGRPFVVNSRCVTTMRGRACCYCSQKVQSATPSLRQLISHYTVFPQVRRCAYCSSPLRKTGEVYVYPRRIYICRRHHSNTLLNNVRQFMAETEDQHFGDCTQPDDAERRDEMEAFIIDFIKKKEADYRQRLVLSSAKKQMLNKLQTMCKREK